MHRADAGPGLRRCVRGDAMHGLLREAWAISMLCAAAQRSSICTLCLVSKLCAWFLFFFAGERWLVGYFCRRPGEFFGLPNGHGIFRCARGQHVLGLRVVILSMCENMCGWSHVGINTTVLGSWVRRRAPDTCWVTESEHRKLSRQTGMRHGKAFCLGVIG